MKLCACIAEYNPLHLGHLKHIEYMKNTLKAQNVAVVMSGNFTQRGEPAVLDKYTRARHAILAGADVVIELPTVFATANAEIFARGAVNLLSALGSVEGLCFGVESGTEAEYIALAKAMNDESKEFKRALKDSLERGVSLAKAKFEAVQAVGLGTFNENLIASPNNILGLEYTKALLKTNCPINIFPMPREGNHNDITLKSGVTSASSIRAALKAGLKKKLKKNLPAFVYKDLKEYPFDFDKITMAAILTSGRERIAEVCDCSEGLENRIKALSKDNMTVEGLVEKVSTKRYPATRIRRILCANLLGITKDFVDDCLNSPTYARILAVNSSNKEILSLISSQCTIPVITRKSDGAMLKRTPTKSVEKDELAAELYSLATGVKDGKMLIV